MDFTNPPDMSIYERRVEDLPAELRARLTLLPDADAMNHLIAREFADALAEKQAKGKVLTVICPVGQVDYRYWVDAIERRDLDCRFLRTINMDEYRDEHDRLIDMNHPLSFRGFMEQSFFGLLPGDNRPLPENIVFPDPQAPERVTAIIDEIGGADLCWAGFGITGHIAFNDPPHMLGEPTDLAAFRNCKTRALTCSPMSTAQMAMGGTHGNLDIVPERCVTIGMYELLKTRSYRLVFTRDWHAGLWRRALLGPVTSEFPGSLLQEHPNLAVYMTELAARVPMLNQLQDTGEESER